MPPATPAPSDEVPEVALLADDVLEDDWKRSCLQRGTRAGCAVRRTVVRISGLE